MIIERFESGEWIEVDFEDLKKGDLFKMFNPDNGALYESDDNGSEFVAASDPYINDDGIFTINIEV